ncbi:Maf family nucleotide pyrophosphatase [Sphingobacterium bovistauri]|uniref:dTTP/UTP pyrophosphatase n=1 Tax=Sphingobacterium bovistauri TaxID=2781959 RepID=A0ABS7Z9W7_9SPHI|nr:Maf family nucleotide pyrophosphatase [Sphingobacterium bovistauri]MCA5006798.1 septum formation protein Maf [Sphingobacterium bovistauri]
MLRDKLKGIEVILGSQSPRRKELLASLDIDFSVVIRSVDETIPPEVKSIESAEYVALKKLAAFDGEEFKNSLVITADTVVVDSDNNVLGKPKSREEAFQVLESLSGKSHQVLTGVAIGYAGKVIHFTDETVVRFDNLETSEIVYYVDKYEPYDKAGAYGIQEWIGRIIVTHIHGSYENVMGLPTARLYRAIKELI